MDKLKCEWRLAISEGHFDQKWPSIKAIMNIASWLIFLKNMEDSMQKHLVFKDVSYTTCLHKFHITERYRTA